MRKLIMLLFLMIFLSIFVASFVYAQNVTCSDSDGGLDYYVKGYAINPNNASLSPVYDSCINNTLFEIYCNNNIVSVADGYNCPYGCKDGACLKEEIPKDMDSCLDSGYYWDQETDNCYNYMQKCSDPDGGKNIFVQAHTFGFRTYSSAEDPKRDLRIRTGGKDACLSETKLIEHYCDGAWNIATTYVDCLKGCKDGACIKGEEKISEQVKCIFKNSDEGQQCYLAGQFTPEDEGNKFCKGKESCVINYKGEEGEEVTWKSTCGGYQYTKQDGQDETIYFDCKSGETNITEIENKGFRNAYWRCYDGVEQKQGEETSCKSSELWQKYANEFCKEHCYEDKSKCGVNTFGVFNECYLDELSEKEIEEEQLKKEEEEGEIKEVEIVCKNSCPLEDKCYPFGYRNKGEYCSDKGTFKSQLEADKSCENNFECKSNVCVNDNCVSGNLIQKIIQWFKRLFGAG